MNQIPPLPAGGNIDAFIPGVCDQLLLAFPGQIRSIYLIGSRAIGTEIESSDVDLAIVFARNTSAGNLPEVRKLLIALRKAGSIMLDCTVIDEEEIARGVTPDLTLNRLLFGSDTLQNAPLKPHPEILLYFARQAMHCIRAARGHPRILSYPLTYPTPGGQYHGYEVNGVRIGEGVYSSGFNILVNLVMALGSFRLARLTNVFAANKSLTADHYRHLLPKDPWLPMIADVYQICRNRWPGQIPNDITDRERLAECCESVLAFENECLDAAVRHADEWAQGSGPALRQQIAEFASAMVASASPYVENLATLKIQFPPTASRTS